MAACTIFDDSAIWDKLDDHENRIVTLETLCSRMNTNINSLQSIITALQESDFITGVTPITENGVEIGYTIHSLRASLSPYIMVLMEKTEKTERMVKTAKTVSVAEMVEILL